MEGLRFSLSPNEAFSPNGHIRDRNSPVPGMLAHRLTQKWSQHKRGPVLDQGHGEGTINHDVRHSLVPPAHHGRAAATNDPSLQVVRTV